MALTPDFDTFARAYEAGENQIVYTRLAADLDTPVSLMLKLTGAAENAFVLESVTGGDAIRWTACAMSSRNRASPCPMICPKPPPVSLAISAMI